MYQMVANLVASWPFPPFYSADLSKSPLSHQVPPGNRLLFRAATTTLQLASLTSLPQASLTGTVTSGHCPCSVCY